MFSGACEGTETGEEIHFLLNIFIINDGVMWQTILNILEKKAAEGVDVRLIYDGFGCLTTLPHKYYEELQKKESNVRYLILSVPF